MAQLTLPGDEMILSISLDKWIAEYKEKQDRAIVEWVNCLIYVAGLQKARHDWGSGNAPPAASLRDHAHAREHHAAQAALA